MIVSRNDTVGCAAASRNRLASARRYSYHFSSDSIPKIGADIGIWRYMSRRCTAGYAETCGGVRKCAIAPAVTVAANRAPTGPHVQRTRLATATTVGATALAYMVRLRDIHRSWLRVAPKHAYKFYADPPAFLQHFSIFLSSASLQLVGSVKGKNDFYMWQRNRYCSVG